jgi:glutathione-regulated potassium-efflux system ancillary protein KefG
MKSVLVLFAHPALEKSRVHRRLVHEAQRIPSITFRDLYEAYPDFNIDVRQEQALLLAHDRIVIQHPLYWYSTPALLKQWQDLVLEHGWAYGAQGNMLRGKWVLSVISTGGGAAAYQHEGHNKFTLRELLVPIEATFRLCKMEYLPPYAIQGTHRMLPPDIERAAQGYRALLERLRDDQIAIEEVRAEQLLNEALAGRLEAA